MAKAESYRHEEEALLRPDVGTQAQFTKKKAPKAHRPAERRRFTIAHELGHWICRYREDRPARFYCRPGDVAAAAMPAPAEPEEENEIDRLFHSKR